MTVTAGRDTGSEAAAPAFNTDYEKVILGVLMSAPEDQAAQVIGEALDLVTPGDFYNPRTADLYRAVIAAHEAGTPIGELALAGWLAERGELARHGGAGFLHECCEMAPLRAQLGYYAKRVKAYADRRRWEAAGIRITQAAGRPGIDIDDIADLAQTLLAENTATSQGMSLVPIGSLIDPCLAAIETRGTRQAAMTFGIADLDLLFPEGLVPGELTLVAGATGMGKSVLLADFARHVALKLGLRVAWFSLEMKRQVIFDRVLSAISRVPLTKIKKGDLDERDWQLISDKSGPLSEAPLWVCDESSMTVAAMIRQCQRLAARHGNPDLIIVDHMHIVRPARASDDETPAMKQISWDLKDKMAMGLNVPVLAGAQLNRNYAGRASKMPELSDLRGASAIEQNCDNAILIHRDDYYDKESPRSGEADLIVAKNRNGATDTVTVAAQLHLSRFVDMAIV